MNNKKRIGSDTPGNSKGGILGVCIILLNSIVYCIDYQF